MNLHDQFIKDSLDAINKALDELEIANRFVCRGPTAESITHIGLAQNSLISAKAKLMHLPRR